MVSSQTYVRAWVDARSSLPHDDSSCDDRFRGVFLDAQPLACAVATVAGTALSFLMCHDLCADFVNLDKGKILPVAVLVAIPFASFHLPNNELFASGVLDHFSLDLGSLDRRGADLH